MKLFLGTLLATALTFGQTLPTGWKLAPAGQQIPLEDFPIASAATRDGATLFVLHAGKSPSLVALDTASWKVASRLVLADAWLGLALAPDQKTLYVGGGSRNSVLQVSWSGKELALVREMAPAVNGALTAADFIGDVALSPDGRSLYAAELFHDSVVVFNLQSGRAVERFKTGRRPYRILFHPDGKSYFVTSWAEGSLYQHDVLNGAELSRLRLGPQTTDIVLSDRKLPDDESFRGIRLFVASSNSNNIFSVGVDENKQMKQLELLNIGIAPAQPAGMTPSALVLSPDQTRLYVACSDGNALAVVDLTESRSRLEGFIPTGAYPTAVDVLGKGQITVLNGQRSSLSFVPAPSEDALAQFTQTVLQNSLYRGEMADQVTTAPSVFDHVVYILTDNAVRGANATKLATEFVRFSGVRALADAPAENHLWAMAGIAPAFTRRLLPARSAGRLRFANFLGGEPANLTPAGYLWSNARIAGLSVRNYGEFVENDRPADPSLTGISNLAFKGPDEARAKIFLDEWTQLSAAGKLPSLAILHLSGDDAAIGKIIEALSKTAQWNKTVVFVAGVNGSAEASSLLAVSPYTRRAITDPAPYTLLSVLRTVELILGLRPMTQFDAAALPLTTAFSNTSDTRPYSAAP